MPWDGWSGTAASTHVSAAWHSSACGTQLISLLVLGPPSLQTGRLAVDGPSQLDGYTPLMIAAACGNQHAVNALLAHGAHPSKRSRRGASM